jgi:hypothetical protein
MCVLLKDGIIRHHLGIKEDREFQKLKVLGTGTHICNPRYSGNGGWEDCS